MCLQWIETCRQLLKMLPSEIKSMIFFQMINSARIPSAPRMQIFKLTVRGQLVNLTSSQVKWTDLINDPGKPCCISVYVSWKVTSQSMCLDNKDISRCVMAMQAQWHLGHVFNSTTWGVIDVYVFGICCNIKYDDVIWPIRRSPANSCAWFIAKLHLNRQR